MPYRIRYQLCVDWIGAGSGPMGNTVGLATGVQPQQSGLSGASGMGQTLNLSNSINVPYPAIVAGSGTGGIIQAADITLLMVGTGSSTGSSMAADLTAQLNLAANLARMQGWVTGGG